MTRRFLPELPRLMVDEAVKAALLEDWGRAGDVTSQATLPPDAKASAVIAARKPGVLAGLVFAESAFRQTDAGLHFEAVLADGDRLSPKAVVARIEGPARALLAAERVALNFLGHLSGIATATSKFADLIAHTKADIVCTRKTTPGLRAFEKYAVKCGGGSNHRFGLDDAILIKDNHIAVAGGVTQAIEAAKAFAGHLVKIEVEVDTLEQLDEALAAGPDVVMLDNMPPEVLKQAVAKAGGKVLLEASGGIELDTVKAVAEAGVDLISSGWITHSAPVLDLGLDIEIG
ncbi:putative nicotinate-nucleotide pyrophosphorylase [carboxylating] [Labrenzia sp. THAF191b]|uniref:carboxylating nicotinate-nucleotide diphosphorylase n=1 Tax=unclassified Labrenzia TaxID=2648686 RepID=UPI001269537C|nr:MULTISPECIES: carboxylating nicotinate-nucleotide diphosphorylase [unclassified Labrenzia]QFS95833.1 putative nicotinate-nucleotide pyrophosphorylase [carboxylating] [Labrenzia sp. THAF191b]QFT02148.1 putative nicotinate-nucleotide pyrophosphorylase [carboxylating] [Labrenzia sp. THAF191a]QFT13689.1 putative nicotinate-nucleotide pyrophosphorylase [carboxylating] [Labrenzia sp. THAF187b]